MNDVIIRSEKLSKKYKIGRAQQRHDTLRDHLMGGLKLILDKALPTARGAGISGNQIQSEDDTIWALKDVSFEINRGEVISFIGRNGAGKSTLLKILSRITEPTKGFAEIRGRVGSLLEVGTGFHGELTGRENTYLNGAILGMKKSEIDRKFDAIVSFAEIEKFIDTPVKRYSSGMYLRLAFAVAAHLEPEILLIDEVLSVGDGVFQRRCLNRIKDIQKSGATVILVSHNLPIIGDICSRAVLLSNGEVAMIGASNQVVDYYLSLNSYAEDIPLAGRKDRLGVGEVIVSAIEFFDEEEKIVQYPVCGRQLVIRVRYECQKKKVFRNAKVLVSIARQDQVCFVLATELVDNRNFDISGNSYLDFILPELPLGAGHYQLSAYIEANDIGQDWITDAAQMLVMDGDFYGTGNIYPHDGWRGKGIFVKHHWKIPSSQSCGSHNIKTSHGQ